MRMDFSSSLASLITHKTEPVPIMTSPVERALARAEPKLRAGNFKGVLKELKPFAGRSGSPLPVLYLIGLAHHGLGQRETAHKFLTQVAKASPKAAPGLFARATIAMDLERFEEARGSLQALLSQQPDVPDLLNNLASCEQALGNSNTALAIWQKALALQPNHAGAAFNLIAELIELGQLEGASAQLDRLGAQTVGASQDLSALAARLHIFLGDFEAARAILAPWEATSDGSGPVCPEFVRLYSITGAVDQALAMALSVVRKNPTPLESALTLYELADRSAKPDKMRREALECARRIRRERGSANRMSAGATLALGQLLDYAGQHHDAGLAYRDGNARLAAALRSGGATYDRDAMDRYVAALEQWTPPAPVEEEGPSTPIFIVGLPRSGTSLVEQILACHSACQGLGESRALGTIAEAIGLGTFDAPYPEGLKRLNSLSPASRAKYRQQYIDAVGGTKPVLIDKFMLNAVFWPLILTLFDRPLILWTDRGFADNALSILSKSFHLKSLITCEPDSLVHYHQAMERALKATMTTAPNRIYRLSYEGLVGDAAQEIPKLVDRVGLPWEQACLTPQSASRTVATASSNQVRVAVNSRAVGRAEPFRGALPELFQR